jgi:F420-non-reducing hydrogenase large subunit
MSRRVTIDPVTRLEGHGKIEIFLGDDGEVENAYFQVPELRGFEAFCRGRMAEEMPVITNRICGVCPEAHHMAAAKALDMLFCCEPSSAASKVRELLYSAFFIVDHVTHFYVLGGPDLIVGPDAVPLERNLLGVVRKLGQEAGAKIIAARKRNHHVIEAIGGRGIHPAGGLPGGWSKPVSEAIRAEAEKAARENIEFALWSLELLQRLLAQDVALNELVMGDTYLHRTYSMGTVDANDKHNFYDGMIRVVDPEGQQYLKYHPRDHATHIAERVEPWSFIKFPYLRAVGWKGLEEGKESGVYLSSPLSRLNAASGMATPRAQEQYEKFYAAFGSSRRADGGFAPVHHRLATHWARLVEVLSASERMLQLATDPEITSPDVRRKVEMKVNPGGGIGSVEAPRGNLTHHYEADERGLLTRVNLVVGTTNNSAAMAMSVKKAAMGLVRRGQAITEGVLNRIEMAFRLYDPCLSCSTHALPGKSPLILTVRDQRGVLERYVRD